MSVMQEKALEEGLESVSDVTKTRRPLSRAGLVWHRLRRMPRFWIGASVVVLVILWAFVGPLVYPWSISDRDVLNMGMGPTMIHWFGTNSIGQDIYAQTLAGLQKSSSSAWSPVPRRRSSPRPSARRRDTSAGGSIASSSGSSCCCS